MPGYLLSNDKLSCNNITQDKLEITLYVNATSGIHNTTTKPNVKTDNNANDNITQNYTLLADA
jgi:hypothetical protein